MMMKMTRATMMIRVEIRMRPMDVWSSTESARLCRTKFKTILNIN